MISIKDQSPQLYSIVMVMAMLTTICVTGFFVDDRTLGGINVWIKPFKFLVSTSIYILTVAYLLPFYPYSKRKSNIIKGLVGWTLMIEMVIVPLQASRGVASHFNQSTIFDGILFGMMGILIGINVIIMSLFILDTIRYKLKTTSAIQLGILLGWIIVLIGSWAGGQMVSQMSHSVGVADGGAGLPLINWSTKGGDLRIAHFFGLHAIQIIPLFAYFISRKSNWNSRNQIIAVILFASTYAFWVGWTLYQAKQGMPIVQI